MFQRGEERSLVATPPSAAWPGAQKMREEKPGHFGWDDGVFFDGRQDAGIEIRERTN